MRKLLALAVSLTCGATPVWAIQQVIVFGRPDSNLSASAVNFIPGTNSGDSPNATEAVLQGLCPISGTVSDLRITLSGSPNNGAGTQSYKFEFSLNGSVASTLNCTISETNTTCQDTTTLKTVAAGDLFAIKVTPSGTPTVRAVRGTLKLHTGSSISALLGGSDNTAVATAADNYVPLGFTNAPSTTEFNTSTIIPAAGTIGQLYAKLSVAPGGSTSYTLTVRSAAAGSLVYSSSSVTCTVTGAATTCNDTTHVLTVAAGDKIDLLVHPSASAPAASVVSAGVAFHPDTGHAGEFVIPGNMGGNLLTTGAVGYLGVTTAGNSENATETNRQQSGNVCTVRAVYVELSAAPNNGVGTQSYAFQFRDGAVNAGPTCTVSEAATTCNNATDKVLAADDAIDTSVTPANTPTAVSAAISYLGYNASARRMIIR